MCGCCWFFSPVDARGACFGPCVVAAAYAAVVDTARYTGMRWLICTCRRVLGGDRSLLWASPDHNLPAAAACLGTTPSPNSPPRRGRYGSS